MGNGNAFFSAYDGGVGGRKLWITDGTEAGTASVEINYDGFDKTMLGSGNAIFTADDGVHGLELWITDGTVGGTKLLKDINSGVSGSGFLELNALGNGKAIFKVDDGIHGSELWVTDGTELGTHLAKDINTGLNSSGVHAFKALGNGKAYFTVDDDGVNGAGLWITDGTATGTIRVKDINQTPLSSNPANFTNFILNVAPTVDTLSASGSEDTTLVINLSGADPDGFVSKFKLAGLPSNGTLFSDAALTQVVTATNDIIANANKASLYFRPDSNWNGNTSFQFVAIDNDGLQSTSNATVSISIAAVNDAPTQEITRILFSANDGINGTELWVTDGTSVGTALVKDIYAGNFGSSPAHITNLGNGKAIFSALDASNGTELWITDGTMAGTALVKDIYAGNFGSNPADITNLGNGKAIFSATDASNGTELWITDGTMAGTVLVKDIYAGANDSFPTNFIALGNGKALFKAKDASNGEELWITDGTTSGTVLVKDIYAGANSSGPTNFTALGNGKAIFSATDASNGKELWITDGTMAGTMLVKDIYAGVSNSNPTDLANLGNGKAIFRATDASHGEELWITDGTMAGTVLVKDIYAGGISSFRFGFLISDFTNLGNGKALFSASDASNGEGLWITDGTKLGTVLVKIGISGALQFTALGNGNAIFSAYGYVSNGNELWITDGTPTGTSMVKKINTVQSSFPYQLTALGNGKAIFRATDASDDDELWITDGTTAGTVLVEDINKIPKLVVSSSPREFMLLANGKAIFNATDASNGSELWITDGTPAGTVLVKDIYAGANSSAPINFTALGNGKAIFSATDASNGKELWITDGTTAGTVLVKDIYAGASNSNPKNFTALGNGKAIFSATDASNGAELWITDGTTAGTVLVKDINAGGSSSSPGGFTALGNGKALFSASDASHGEEVWITDGTTAGTVLVKDIYTGSGGSSPLQFTALGIGKAVFSAYDVSNGNELWITDGTPAGTSMVKKINTVQSSFPGHLTALGNGKAIFSAYDASNGSELWITDGTTSGTVLVKDIYAGANDSFPTNFIALGNGKALFKAKDASNGEELWITDGTTSGTVLVKDIYAGANSSGLTNFTALGNGKIIFSASDSTNGQELWITDGTMAGTLLVKDIYAGANDSFPTNFTSLGNGKALFSATDASNGNELWITDGTTAGTKLLKDLYTITFPSNPSGFVTISVNNASGTEDTTLAINLTGADSDGTISSFKATVLPANGDLYSDQALTQVITTSTVITATTNRAILYFKPNANWHGETSFQFVAIDNEGLQSTDNATVAIAIAAVNDAPTATNHLVTTRSNTDYVFSLAEFSYSDPETPALHHLAITGLPSAGVLYLDNNANHIIDSGEALLVNANVAAADIAHLTFKPVAGDIGSPYSSFSFKVSDGTLDSVSSYQMSINVYNEQSVPNVTGGAIGDGNGDGIQDSTQSNVESLQLVVQTNPSNPVVSWATLVAPTDASISNAHVEAAPANLPIDTQLPFGVLSFDVNSATVGASRAMTIYLTGTWQSQANGQWHELGSDAVINGYWKQSTNGTWHNLANQFALDGGKLRIDFTLKDGDPISDADGIANGVIDDPGAPGFFASADILTGGLGSDDYSFDFDSGYDTIIENGNSGDIDRILLGNALTINNVGLVRNGNNLLIELRDNVGNLSNTMTVQSHFLGPVTGIEQIVFGNGTSWNQDTIVARSLDTDGDGVQDIRDNAILVANPNQRDTDGDGYGNIVDADLNQSGFVDAADLGLFARSFGTTNPNADFNGSGFVDAADIGVLARLFGKVPGPSYIDNIPLTAAAVQADTSSGSFALSTESTSDPLASESSIELVGVDQHLTVA